MIEEDRKDKHVPTIHRRRVAPAVRRIVKHHKEVEHLQLLLATQQLVGCAGYDPVGRGSRLQISIHHEGIKFKTSSSTELRDAF